jgi:hypothetical protein
MRWLALFAAGVASVGQLAAAAVAAPCARLFESRYLWPVGLVLLPIAVFAVLLAMPFWVLAMVSNSYLMVVDGVHGSVEVSGIRLTCRRALPKCFVAWSEIRSVRWVVTPPLGSHYLIALENGSELRVDFLPDEEFQQACRRHEVGGNFRPNKSLQLTEPA